MDEKRLGKQRVRLRAVFAVSALAILIAIGTGLFHRLEDWTLAESFYFSVSTVTTVGYGDLIPSTDFSRIVASFYMIIGVTIALAALGIIGTAYIERQVRLISSMRDKDSDNPDES